MHATGEYTIADLAELFSISRATVYRARGTTGWQAALAPLPTDTRPTPSVEPYDQLLTRTPPRA